MKNRRKVAVVIPVHNTKMSVMEVMSLTRCKKVLKDYPKILVGPTSLDLDSYQSILSDFEFRAFADDHFASERGYNALLRGQEFYQRFLDFDYILIYQLDCHVFEDSLRYWCDQGYDYVGAPWLDFDWLGERNGWLGRIPGLKYVLRKVGNGGLSLRRVETFYRAAGLLGPLARLVDLHEDLYWCNVACRLYPRFRIANFEHAIQFAFERHPRRCFELNGGKLPFGCHAFEKYDFDFWKSKFDPDDLALIS